MEEELEEEPLQFKGHEDTKIMVGMQL